MDEDRNDEPTQRFKTILSADKDDPNAPPNPLPSPQSQSILDRLPRLKPDTQATPKTELQEAQVKPEPSAAPETLSKLPESTPPEETTEEQPAKQEQVATPQASSDMSRREKALRALWTTTSLISMLVNIVVILVLIVVLWAYRNYGLPEGIDIMVLNRLLSGLYSNFELMDNATISTAIPVQDEIPVQFDLELKQPTTVTLSEDVTIRGAYVVINTAVIDISAPAVVTLPAGTNLPIFLDLVVPVDKRVPVNLNVAVDIPLNETELHTPFVGLQDVVKPLYCLVEPAAASSLTGNPVCATPIP